LPLNFSYIAIGALTAASDDFRRYITRLASGPAISAAALLLFLQYFKSFAIAYNYINCAKPFLIAVVIFGTLKGRGPFVWIISQEWLRRIGLASYSLYLWQQLSTGPHHNNAVLMMPILFIGPALLSYFFIERPMVRIGHRLSNMILRQSPRFKEQREAGSARSLSHGEREANPA
jgi:peptidoglycan/LPS O-acetylase OafA/YrhL